jgi:hypothetical protein
MLGIEKELGDKPKDAVDPWRLNVEFRLNQMALNGSCVTLRIQA